MLLFKTAAEVWCNSLKVSYWPLVILGTRKNFQKLITYISNTFLKRFFILNFTLLLKIAAELWLVMYDFQKYTPPQKKNFFEIDINDTVIDNFRESTIDQLYNCL